MEQIDLKECKICHSIKDVTLFRKGKRYKNGRRPVCISCDYERTKETVKLYFKNNKEKIYAKHKEYRALSKEKNLKKHKEWIEKNKDKIRETDRKYQAKRKSNDIGYKIMTNTRSKISCEIRGRQKYKSTKDLLGCSVEELKKHLESKFINGMSWENYGMRGWHIDHIKPCSLFDLSNPNEQKECFHYTNLQPLWAIDNIKKSNKYEH